MDWGFEFDSVICLCGYARGSTAAGSERLRGCVGLQLNEINGHTGGTRERATLRCHHSLRTTHSPPPRGHALQHSAQHSVQHSVQHGRQG
eukprot:gene1552-1488_t